MTLKLDKASWGGYSVIRSLVVVLWFTVLNINCLLSNVLHIHEEKEKDCVVHIITIFTITNRFNLKSAY